jgi:TonB family protein
MLKSRLRLQVIKPFVIAMLVLLCPLAHAAGTEQQKFMEAVTASIDNVVVVPCETPQTAEIKVQLDSFPNGYLKGLYVVKSSGYPLYDKAVLKAIATAQPLPNDNPVVLKNLATTVMYFRPSIPAYRCNLQPLEGEIPNVEFNEAPATSKEKAK